MWRRNKLRPPARAALLSAFLNGGTLRIRESAGAEDCERRGLFVLLDRSPVVTPQGAYRRTEHALTIRGLRVAAQLLANGRGHAAIEARRRLGLPTPSPRDRSQPERPRFGAVLTVRSTSNATPVANQVDRLPPGRYTVVATAQDPEPPTAPADGTPRAKE